MKKKLSLKSFLFIFVIYILLEGSFISWAISPDSQAFISQVSQTNQITLPPSDNNYQEVKYVPGELIVMIKEEKAANLSLATTGNHIGTNDSSLDKLFEKFNVYKAECLYKGDNKEETIKGNLSTKQQIKRRRLKNIFKLTVSKDIDIHAAVLEFKNNENIEYAEPNYLLRTSLIPNDTNFIYQWALHNTGQTSGSVDADIDAPEAWDNETGDPAIIIAVIDTGVDWDHPDLASNIWINSDEIPGDGVDNDNNGYIDDYRGWDFVSAFSYLDFCSRHGFFRLMS